MTCQIIVYSASLSMVQHQVLVGTSVGGTKNPTVLNGKSVKWWFADLSVVVAPDLAVTVWDSLSRK